jgi:hypothetical protein
LGTIVERQGVRTLLYVGGGSGVFMEVDDLTLMIRTVLRSPGILLVNNFYSTDFAAFGKDLDLEPLRRCQKDNHIGWILGREEGAGTRVLPSNLKTRFDIDTPAELILLRACPPGGRHLSAIIEKLPLDLSPLRRVLEVLVCRDRRAIVMGRVSSEAALHLDRETACHLRFYIEERGMETRQNRRRIWSLAGFCIESWGISRLLEALSTQTDAAIVDTRVLFGHLKLRLSRQDRFLSDLGLPERITNPVLRHFTEEVRECPIPFLLGGHTLVSGGLYGLAKSAWKDGNTSISRGFEETTGLS